MDTIEPSSLGILTLSGFNVSLSVDKDHLVIKNGTGSYIRQARFHRALASFNRIVIHGHTGYITLAALKWLCDKGIALLQINYDTTLIFANSPFRFDNPRLRRQQVAASMSDVGLVVARYLIRRKIIGQLNVLKTRNKDNNSELGQYADLLSRATTLQTIIDYESKASTYYWRCLANIPVYFKRTQKAIPEHWKTLGTRVSPISNHNNQAVTPAQAMLNYLYSLLMSECIIVLDAVGIDSGLGIFHADKVNRGSFALDIMEAIRPDVDHYLLDMVHSTVFNPALFVETSAGQCRLLPEMARQLCQTLPLWREKVQPIIADVVRVLSEQDVHSPTIGHQHIQRELKPIPLCKKCGKEVPNKRRVFCSKECRRTYTISTDTHTDFERSGITTLAALRSEGLDPSTTEAANQKRRQTQLQRYEHQRQYEALHPPQPDEASRWHSEYLPRVQSTPIRTLARASGLSLRACSLIRRGELTPHPMYWARLLSATDNDTPS